jgi:predicted ATP-dependent serine protease
MLLHFAKTTGTIFSLSGIVTKDGAIAGPRILEHMVIPCFTLKVTPVMSTGLSCGKNRFGDQAGNCGFLDV